MMPDSDPGKTPEFEIFDVSKIQDSLGDANFDIDKERFNLARSILHYLFWLLIFLVIAMMIPSGILNEEIKNIFNTIFQSIVPIASLIIGYYFGSKGDKE